MTDVGIFIALSAGVLSFLSPCVLPLVPSYLTFVTGMSLEDLEEGVERGRVFRTALLFTLGFSLVFMLLGASASFLGQFFRSYEDWLARIGGVVLIVLGLHLAGLFRLTPLLREKRVHVSGTPVGALGAVGVGMAFGAGWTPCIGPVLGGILTYATVQDTFWSGVGLLGVYSAGLAIPFLVSALALDRFLHAFKRIRPFLGAVQVISGVLLIFLGILLLTGAFTILTTWLVPFTPDFLQERI
ncbi:MAG: cytochrome c biogenesis protein CcdA [Gemmatimonadales bacterium]|nr:MAG: cytochrome c biogenesis protein CcdA [Gemmatimonadales bacterium]